MVKSTGRVRKGMVSNRKKGRYRTYKRHVRHQDVTVIPTKINVTSTTQSLTSERTDTISTLTSSPSTTEDHPTTKYHRQQRYYNKLRISQIILNEGSFKSQCDLLVGVISQPEFSEHVKKMVLLMKRIN